MRSAAAALLLLSCAPALPPAAPPPAEAETPAGPPGPPNPALFLGAPHVPAAAPAKPERHLAHDVCVGVTTLPKEPPHTAACCYPARELILRPLRAAFPALRACFDARADPDAGGRVLFRFRVEQDGSVKRVCAAAEVTTMDDEPALRCMVDALSKAQWPGMSNEEAKLCGLLTLNYPVVFE